MNNYIDGLPSLRQYFGTTSVTIAGVSAAVARTHTKAKTTTVPVQARSAGAIWFLALVAKLLVAARHLLVFSHRCETFGMDMTSASFFASLRNFWDGYDICWFFRNDAKLLDG